MNNSLAQEDYSITLTNDQLSAIDSTISTITLSDGSCYSSCYTTNTWNTSCHTIGTICIGGGGTGGTYIGGGAGGTYSIDMTTIFGNIEFENSFPDWARIQKMCDLYPGLKIALEKFKTTYMLVKDDYDAPPEKKIKP